MGFPRYCHRPSPFRRSRCGVCRRPYSGRLDSNTPHTVHRGARRRNQRTHCYGATVRNTPGNAQFYSESNDVRARRSVHSSFCCEQGPHQHTIELGVHPKTLDEIGNAIPIRKREARVSFPSSDRSPNETSFLRRQIIFFS